jgi:hypothetical protein
MATDSGIAGELMPPPLVARSHVRRTQSTRCRPSACLTTSLPVSTALIQEPGAGSDRGVAAGPHRRPARKVAKSRKLSQTGAQSRKTLATAVSARFRHYFHCCRCVARMNLFPQRDSPRPPPLQWTGGESPDHGAVTRDHHDDRHSRAKRGYVRPQARRGNGLPFTMGE